MDERSFEKYCFLRLYAIDLNTALHTIKVLQRYKRPDVQYPLLRDIAVTYARPFSGNRGEHTKKHFLSDRYVPKSLETLHKELIRLRKNRFAHTDITHYRPKVAKFGGRKKPWFPMSFKGYDYETLLKQLSGIKALVCAVEQSICNETAAYEEQLKLCNL